MKRKNLKSITFNDIYDEFCNLFSSYYDVICFADFSTKTIELRCFAYRHGFSDIIVADIQSFCKRFGLSFSFIVRGSKPVICIFNYEN